MTPPLTGNGSLRLTWPWTRLGNHVSKVGSGFTPLGGQSVYRTSGIGLIRSQNVLMNRFEPQGLAYISVEQDAEMSGSRVLAGDVLLNITGASIGRVCVAPAEVCPANVNQHVCIIRPDASIIPEFLVLYLATPQFQKFIVSSQAGATRQALTKAMVEDFRIPLLPAGEQQRLVDRLHGLLGEVARARAAVKAQLEAARKLPAASLRAAFQFKDSNAWTFQPLAELCELLPSKSISTGGDAEVHAITTACLTEAGFQRHGIKSARMWADDAAECRVQSGEILIARSNTSELVGRVSIYQGDPPGVVASDLTIRIWPSTALIPEFLCHYLSYLFVEGFWRERAGGASGSMKKITRSQIAELPVPVAPTDQQRYVARKLAYELESSVSLTEALRGRGRLLDCLPATLLGESFRGAH